eukprot:11175575-Lingulodinium_polyedra.AAC.1
MVWRCSFVTNNETPRQSRPDKKRANWFSARALPPRRPRASAQLFLNLARRLATNRGRNRLPLILAL